MSHLRNLFYNPPEQDGEIPPPIPLVSAKPTLTVTAPAVGGYTGPGGKTTVAFPVETVQTLPKDRIVYHSDPRGPAADRFRLLRMRLKEASTKRALKKLLISSPLPHDGKTTLTLNLATALSDRGKRSVLVIEGDLHHRSICEVLRLGIRPGLAECLQDESLSPFDAIRRIEPLGWCFLPAGETQKNPTDLLHSRGLGPVLEGLAGAFDWVLIDSPPVIPLTDALSLRQHCDATLLVVRAGQTPREAVEQTVALIGEKHLAGIVLNGAKTRNHSYYQYRYYDGHARNQEEG